MDFTKTLKYTFIRTFKRVLNLYYHLLVKIRPLDKQKVIIVCSRNNRLEGNLSYIYAELKEQLKGAKIHFVYTRNKMNLSLFKEIFLLSNAQYVILDDYFLAIYLIKPIKSMKIIQLWHAAGAFKKFGYSTIGTKFGPDIDYIKIVPVHSNYTHVYVSSKKIAAYYAEAFNMSEKRIFPLGIPRTDLFFNEQHQQKAINNIISYYPELVRTEKVNLLIAPTYRARGSYKESNVDFVKILLEIAHKINDNINILFKPHPYVSDHELNTLRNAENIILLDDDIFINDWMLLADGFITDYSSSIFEFALLSRPLCHFAPDIYEYEKNRGFYQEIDKISDGVILTKKEELINWMNRRKKGEYFNTSRMIKENFDNLGNVSKDIVMHFIYE